MWKPRRICRMGMICVPEKGLVYRGDEQTLRRRSEIERKMAAGVHINGTDNRAPGADGLFAAAARRVGRLSPMIGCTTRLSAVMPDSCPTTPKPSRQSWLCDQPGDDGAAAGHPSRVARPADPASHASHGAAPVSASAPSRAGPAPAGTEPRSGPARQPLPRRPGGGRRRRLHFFRNIRYGLDNVKPGGRIAVAYHGRERVVARRIDGRCGRSLEPRKWPRTKP